ncbi:hypothetical protein QJQ45_016624 [Haematococcus lacustris]|nr:hypothetical protein QJQ45_016624 [Haematococcus lacustris]
MQLLDDADALCPAPLPGSPEDHIANRRCLEQMASRINISSRFASSRSPPSAACRASSTPPSAAAASVKHHTVEEVKAILKEENARHGLGRVMSCQLSGQGKRLLCGTEVQHVGNLSGEDAIKSVDYSLYG